MHTFIYQITQEPIDKADFFDIGDTEKENMPFDYAKEITSEEREEAIVNLLEAHHGMFKRDGKAENGADIITYQGGIDNWKVAAYEKVQALAANITAFNLFKLLGPANHLRDYLIDPLGTGMLFVLGKFYEVSVEHSDEWMFTVDNLKEGDKLYVCGVVGCHA